MDRHTEPEQVIGDTFMQVWRVQSYLLRKYVDPKGRS